MIRFRKKLQSLKISNYQADFLTELEKILNLCDDEELHYSDKLIICLSEVEKYI